MTTEQRQLSRKYLFYKTLANMWFLGAVWLYFYRLFITDQQIGILDGMAFAIGLLAEVPSGALADKFGRDKMVKIGQLLAGIGILIQAFGSSFMPFFVGQAVLMIGVAFVSGADEALFFERLKFKKSTDWRKLVTRGTQMALFGSLLALIIGGWLHTIDPRYPWYATGIAFILAAFLIWDVKDSRVRKAQQKFSVEIKEYLLNIKIGFQQFRLPKLWLYVPIILTVQGIFYTADWGVLRLFLLDRFHFEPFWGSMAVASHSLITVGVLALIHKHADNIKEKHVITWIALSAIASLLLSLANVGLWGYFILLAIYIGEHVLHPFMSEILNIHAPSDQRATVLSVASFLKSLPYVVLAPIIGILNMQGKLEYFLIVWAVLIGVALLMYLSLLKQNVIVTIKD